ncbi:MAG: hypothetical protein K9K38_04180 [Rhodoferax sp.]|nr:hypothetical protein [Rhodoferax sp.]MCF8208591.1 hypothetical protein [Rhodoferax sp.]
MLTSLNYPKIGGQSYLAQAGMVMMFALIILVLMSLGGLALLRSMDTSNMIAGNMAFQQSATHSSDVGVEAAINWLETNNAAAGVLNVSIPVAGYAASTPAVAATLNGETFWNFFTPSGLCFLPVAGGACTAAPGVPDAAGNTVAFMIQRLCSGTGAAAGNGCAALPGATAGNNSGNNEGAGEELIAAATASTAVYYRITVRVNGPRNAVSYVQAVVSM